MDALVALVGRLNDGCIGWLAVAAGGGPAGGCFAENEVYMRMCEMGCKRQVLEHSI